MSVRDCLEFTPGLEVGDLAFVGRFRAREAAWCCQVMACGRGKRRGREAIRWVFGTTEARSRGWAFDYVRARPAESRLSGPCLLKAKTFHPAATRPKTNYLSGDRADHSSSPLHLTVRFMGLSENASEAKKDHAELSARVKAGQPIYGETDLTDYVQSVAARNSTWSQLKLSVMPW